MTSLWIAIGALVLCAIIVIALMIWKMRSRGISASGRAKVKFALQSALSQHDPVRRMLAVDSVLDLTLTELGFTGSLGDKLKKAGPRIQNLQAVWDAHKLRNRIAHEHDATVGNAQVDHAVRSLERAIIALAS